MNEPNLKYEEDKIDTFETFEPRSGLEGSYKSIITKEEHLWDWKQVKTLLIIY